MGNDAWEQGKVKVPRRAWAAVERDVRRWRDVATHRCEKAAAAVYDHVAGPIPHPSPTFATARTVAVKKLAGSDEFVDHVLDKVLTVRGEGGDSLTPDMVREPEPGDWPRSDPTVAVVQGDEVYVVLDPRDRTLVWRVHPGKHAPDKARGEGLAKAVLDALYGVEWTRGSGGKILRASESSVATKGPGNDGTFVVDAFGPLGGAGTGRTKRPPPVRGVPPEALPSPPRAPQMRTRF